MTGIPKAKKRESYPKAQKAILTGISKITRKVSKNTESGIDVTIVGLTFFSLAIDIGILMFS